MVQDDMRDKYKDAIESLEEEITRLRARLFNIARPRPRRIDF